MGKMALEHGKSALFDDEDAGLIAQYRWHAAKGPGGHWYVHACRDGRLVVMHRLISHAPPDQEVDHRNGDGLDNRRENLRICIHQQNICNRRKLASASSKFKGVWFEKHDRLTKPWRAAIMTFGKRTHLGYYATEEEAAKAYDEAAVKCHGDFALLNFARPG